MNDFLNTLQSQLIYVIENQLKIKEEHLVKKLGTPDNLDIIDNYFEELSNEITLILENNYQFILSKSVYLLDKLPDINLLNNEERNTIKINITDFINNQLSTLLFQKVSNSILN